MEEILRNYSNLYNRHHAHEQQQLQAGPVAASAPFSAAEHGTATAAEVAAVAAAFGDIDDQAAVDDAYAQSPPRRSDRLRSPR